MFAKSHDLVCDSGNRERPTQCRNPWRDIKDGKITAALATSFPVSTWTSVDIAARFMEGAQPTASEKAGEVPEQILEQKDITFDPSTGWLGFNDFAHRFATVWHTSS